MSGREPDRRVVAVCTAKDCRRADGHAELVEALTGDAGGCRLVTTKCLEVCDGPVVVVGLGDERATVIGKVRRRKQRADLLAFVAGAPLSARLRAERVTGKVRRRALDRVRPR